MRYMNMNKKDSTKPSMEEILAIKDQKKRNKAYNQYVENMTPKSNCFANCAKAFLVGGLICTLGEGLNSFYEYLGEVITPVISSRLSPFFSRDPYREFYTDLLMHTYRDAIVRWVMEGCKIPPKTFVRLLYNAANVMSKLKPSNE